MTVRAAHLCVLAGFAAPGIGQTPIPALPVAEWSPGLSAVPDSFSRSFAHARFIPVDVDGDGDFDAVQYGSWDRSGLLTVTINEGGGRFTTRVMPPAHTQAWWGTYWIGVGDIDGDGDPDVVVPALRISSTIGTDRPWVHLNDGRGNFTLDYSRFSDAPLGRWACTLADMDRDGDLDAVFFGGPSTTINGYVELWLNDGRGNFNDVSAARLPPATHAMGGATGDLDGDGLPDIVLGSSNTGQAISKRVLWSDPSGVFTLQILPHVGEVLEVFLFDADGDRDLDIFFSGGWKHLYRNDGQRNLVQVPFPANPTFTDAPVSLGDIDADGDTDIVIREFVLLNDGRGRFTETPASAWFPGFWTGLADRFAFADLDGDGDQDAFALSAFFVRDWTGSVFYNRYRQVWGPPTVARGSTYHAEVTGRPSTTFALAAHAALLNPPWPLGPLGTWWLDPGTLVVLPPVRCNLLGTATLPIPIPNVPALAGKTLFLQGMDLGASVPQLVHATGYWAVRIQ